MEFEEFLNYIIVRDKQGNYITVNKKQILKQYDIIKNIINNQRK